MSCLLPALMSMDKNCQSSEQQGMTLELADSVVLKFKNLWPILNIKPMILYVLLSNGIN